MKKIIGFIGVITAFIASCSGGDSTRKFITGTYVQHSSGEFSTADDTLVITFLSGDICTINRRTGFQKIRDGVVLPKEFHFEKWTGHYNSETGQLTETRRGRVMTFHPEERTMRLETSEYRKIK